jgi:Sulfotransferase domain.
MYADDLPPLDDPVFITSLPRSGTSILLRILCDTGHFASHTYRDMPFVLCPMLWNQFSHQFHADGTAQERAHGDGLEVSADSPEAFEEVVWKHFWPEHYHSDRIRPWTPNDRDSEFNAFFETHMQKVRALRSDNGNTRRYASKNNLNIARLAAPPAPLQNGTVLIPFRDPVQQAASMYRQHERFLDIHREDDFVREYMEAIGHHEFGEGLRPINFDDWLDDAPPPSDLAFWVQYWTTAYEHVLSHQHDSTVLLSYARLTEEPDEALSELADAVEVPEADLRSQADRLHPPRTHDVDTSAVPGTLLKRAADVYERLEQVADI